MSLRKHKCLDCGYLCLKQEDTRFLGTAITYIERRPEYENITRYFELTTKRRNDFKANDYVPFIPLFCYRRDYTFENKIEALKNLPPTESALELDKFIRASRKCDYFLKHITGYDSAQHMTRWEAIDRERANRRWSILYVLLGALLTLIGAIVIRLLFASSGG